MVSHMVFLTKLGFGNLKNLVTPSPFCKVGRVTELPDGRVTSLPWETKKFQGLDDDFGLKRSNGTPTESLIPEPIIPEPLIPEPLIPEPLMGPNL